MPRNGRNLTAWNILTIRKVASASGRPAVATDWLAQVHKAESIDDLADSGECKSLDSKFVSAYGADFKDKF